MFTRMRSSVAFSRNEQHRRTARRKTRTTAPTPSISSPHLSTTKTGQIKPSASKMQLSNSTTNLSVPRSQSDHTTSRLAVPKSSQGSLDGRSPSQISPMPSPSPRRPPDLQLPATPRKCGTAQPPISPVPIDERVSLEGGSPVNVASGHQNQTLRQSVLNPPSSPRPEPWSSAAQVQGGTREAQVTSPRTPRSPENSRPPLSPRPPPSGQPSSFTWNPPRSPSPKPPARPPPPPKSHSVSGQAPTSLNLSVPSATGQRSPSPQPSSSRLSVNPRPRTSTSEPETPRWIVSSEEISLRIVRSATFDPAEPSRLAVSACVSRAPSPEPTRRLSPLESGTDQRATLPVVRCLTPVPRPSDHRPPTARSFSSESDSNQVNGKHKPKHAARSSNGEQRRRSWRTAMMEAKQKAWNALKSSATFHGVPSPATNATSITSGYCSATTGATTSTVSQEEISPATRVIHAKASQTLSASSKKDKRKQQAKRSTSAKNPRAISVPAQLCDQTSWSQDSSTAEAVTLFNLTPRQRQSLRGTWYRIRGNGGLKFAERIFETLSEAAPTVKDIFYKAAFLSAFENSRRVNQPSEASSCRRRPSATITTCRDHAWIVLRLLDSLILDWDEDGEGACTEATIARLRRYGAQHAFLAKSAGMRADLWEMFGEVAVDIVRRYDCIRANTDTSRAWRILFASITDEVREGYEREVRKRLVSSLD